MIFADGLHIVVTPSHSFENCCKLQPFDLERRIEFGRALIDFGQSQALGCPFEQRILLFPLESHALRIS
jgi:hypothetical protein